MYKFQQWFILNNNEQDFQINFPMLNKSTLKLNVGQDTFLDFAVHFS